MKKTMKLLGLAVLVMVVTTRFVAVAAAIDVSVEEGDRDKSGTPTVHKSDEAPQVARNEPLTKPASEGTERVGFEPTEPEGSLVFETSPFSRSGTSPWGRPCRAIRGALYGPTAAAASP